MIKTCQIQTTMSFSLKVSRRKRSVHVRKPDGGFRSAWTAASHRCLSQMSPREFVQMLKFQMSLSSFGNFRASGAAVQLVPDCSSALGLYVPSVCLFFLTTKKSQARTARAMTTTATVTVGATIAAMLIPWKRPVKAEQAVQSGDTKCFQLPLTQVFFHSHQSYLNCSCFQELCNSL